MVSGAVSDIGWATGVFGYMTYHIGGLSAESQV
jgi:Zn-dependent M32 family carboxypeptidase